LFPVGELVPDVELRTPAGDPIRLADHLSGATLLIFLRHLA
jgi:hypothetical protein